MDTLVTTVAGATQFNLSLDLSALIGGLPPSFAQTYLINNVAYKNDGAAHDFQCWLQLSGGAATERIDIINVTNETGFDKAGCRIPIPRDESAGLWLVRFTTTGKAATGSFILSATLASVEVPS